MPLWLVLLKTWSTSPQFATQRHINCVRVSFAGMYSQNNLWVPSPPFPAQAATRPRGRAKATKAQDCKNNDTLESDILTVSDYEKAVVGAACKPFCHVNARCMHVSCQPAACHAFGCGFMYISLSFL